MPRRIEFPGYKARMEEVRRELKASGTTQQQLAERAALPAWQVSHLLNGGLPEDIEDFRRFADAAGKPIGWFLLDEPEIEALIQFTRAQSGKGDRRQGRRPTVGSLLLALSVASASVCAWPSGGGAVADATTLPAVYVVETMPLLGRWLRILLARRVQVHWCPA